MEPFSPGKSRVFAAAALANLYYSPLFLAVRIGTPALVLVIGVFLHLNFILLTLSFVSLLVSLETFFRLKLLRPSLILLSKNRTNLAESIKLDTARFLIKRKNYTLKSFMEALIDHHEILFTLYRSDVKTEELRQAFSSQGANSPVVWDQVVTIAAWWARKEGRESIDKLDFLLAILSLNKDMQRVLFQKKIKEADLLNIVYWARHIHEEDERPFWEKPVESMGPGIGEAWIGGWTLETEKVALDLTREIQRRKITFDLIGREREIQLVEEVLSRNEKRNVLLVGAPGIGKKSLVYALADKSMRGVLPPILQYKKFIEIDVTALLADAGPGQLESRIQSLLAETTHAGNIVLYIPDLENLAGGSGTGINISGHLINALASSRIQVIATTDHQALHKFIQSQTTFSSLFEVIELEEPTNDSVIRILEQSAPKAERESGVIITYKALSRIIELAQRYVTESVMPGKAIDLLDEAASAAALKGKKLLEESDVDEVLTQKTKLPVGVATGKEAQKLLHLEDLLHQRIIGQNEAINAISNSLRRARSIERDTRKPIGSFLFLGPTGVGKTETAKTLAAYYFKSEESMIRLDMSEFQTMESINRLVGSPPGTSGSEEVGQLSEKILDHPYSLVLLDEMEKAHTKIQEAFLPVFDEGLMEDAQGRKLVFTNTIIIATSNAGAEYIRESLQKQIPIETIRKALLENLQREGVFKPEFLNRFDDIIVYKPLNPEEIRAVVVLILNTLSQRLQRQDVTLEVDQATVNWIAQKGFDVTLGARPLKRFVADHVEERIAEKILSGEIKRGQRIDVKIESDQVQIYISQGTQTPNIQINQPTKPT